MRAALSICICSVILISLICGCSDSGEPEADPDPKGMVLDYLFYLNSGKYTDAVSMLLTSEGERVEDSVDNVQGVLDYLVDTYGSFGERIEIHMTSILNENVFNVTGDNPYTVHHFDVRVRIPMSYSWGEDQGIISIEVAHFSDKDRWGILTDDDNVKGSLAVIPLDPLEGDMEITVTADRSFYPIGADSIPLEIEIENVCGHPLVVEYPMRIGLGHYIMASNGSRIREAMDFCDRDIDHMIFEIGGSWTYDFDIGSVDHYYEDSDGPFSWDVPGEYTVVFTHHSYGLDLVVFKSEGIMITIADGGGG